MGYQPCPTPTHLDVRFAEWHNIQPFWPESFRYLTSKSFLTDVQPPSIQCPSDKETPTESGQSYARVTWQVPAPTDNSNDPLNLSGLLPPQSMAVGTTYITYKATDPAGLSRSCTFSIHVKGKCYIHVNAIISKI